MQSAIAASLDSIANQSNGASTRVMSAIQNAATRTGVDFSYLVKKAAQESGFNATAKASTSSATGLFQFTSQTWLQMVKTNGAQYGLGQYASQIKADSDGHLSVADSATRKDILNLRNDPTVAAEMAGELDKQNAASLKSSVGGKIGGTELYLAHFLGAGGASNFISEMRNNPSATAADVLPEAAAANPSVFYTKSGEAKSLGQIYQHFAKNFDSTRGAVQIASATPKPAATPAITGLASLGAVTGIASTHMASLDMSGLSALNGNNIGNSVTATQSAAVLSSAATVRATTSQIASSGATTLFTAMLLGQMNGGNNSETAALSALGKTDQRKEAGSIYGAVA